MTADGFRPIAYYSGLMDGNDKVISNMYINTNTSSVGLIGELSGYTNNSGIVWDLTIDAPEIRDGSYVGGLIGSSNGATVSNITITNMNLEGRSYIGGLIGNATNTNVSNIDITDSFINCVGSGGGLIGTIVGNGSKVKDVVVEADVLGSSGYIGGIVGYNASIYPSEIVNNFSNANITVKTNGKKVWGVGGVMGELHKYSNTFTDLKNVYYSGDINLEYVNGGTIQDVGGMIGSSSSVSTNPFAMQDLFTTMNITYPTTVVPLADETELNIGRAIGINKFNNSYDQVLRTYLYDGQTINGAILPANRYVGNNPSTDTACIIIPRYT